MEDASRRPNRSPRRIAPHFESLIAAEGKIAGNGAQRLGAFLFQKYGYRFSMETVKKVPKRNEVPEKRIRAKNNNRRPLYDYEDLSEFR